MQEQSGEMKEVELEKNGAWRPKSIFTIRLMSEIESVEDYKLQLSGNRPIFLGDGGGNYDNQFLGEN